MIIIHSASKQHTHIRRSIVTIGQIKASEFTLGIHVPNSAGMILTLTIYMCGSGFPSLITYVQQSPTKIIKPKHHQRASSTDI